MNQPFPILCLYATFALCFLLLLSCYLYSRSERRHDIEIIALVLIIPLTVIAGVSKVVKWIKRL